LTDTLLWGRDPTGVWGFKMRFHINLAIRALVGALALTTLACGKKGKAENAKLKINPTKPIVITGDIKIGGADGTTVTGPWYKFTVKMENGTDETITIVSVIAEATGSDGGTFKTVENTFDPSMGDYSTEFYECFYRSFGEFKPKKEAPNDPDSLHFPSTDNNNTNCRSGTVTFYSSGNPKSEISKNYRYNGKLKIIGWFGTYDDPTDRFEKTVYFSTQ